MYFFFRPCLHSSSSSQFPDQGCHVVCAAAQFQDLAEQKHLEQEQKTLFRKVSSQFIVGFTFSTAKCSGPHQDGVRDKKSF